MHHDCLYIIIDWSCIYLLIFSLRFPCTSRVLQGYAEQGQNGFPRHVQKDVRNDVRTELVPVPGSVQGPGKVLRRWQHEHRRGVGKLLLGTLPENVHSHEQPVYVRRKVSDFLYVLSFRRASIYLLKVFKLDFPVCVSYIIYVR